jgi:hypothetical protein
MSDFQTRLHSALHTGLSVAPGDSNGFMFYTECSETRLFLGGRYRKNDELGDPSGYGVTFGRQVEAVLKAHGAKVEVVRKTTYHGADMRHGIPYEYSCMSSEGSSVDLQAVDLQALAADLAQLENYSAREAISEIKKLSGIPW